MKRGFLFSRAEPDEPDRSCHVHLFREIRRDCCQARQRQVGDDAFASLAQSHADGLVVSPNALFVARRERIVELASRNAVPAIYGRRQFVTAGGLISYGSSLTTVYRRMALYVAKVLSGATPGDLPVQQPAIFELVVNLKTADALGLTVPPSILARTDEVIE